jgi:3-demethoxyubiquinol 3-hydroxylase
VELEASCYKFLPAMAVCSPGHLGAEFTGKPASPWARPINRKEGVNILDFLDNLVAAADIALRTLNTTPRGSRLCPNAETKDQLTASEKKLSGELMRVNHVGEVCAQAMYSAQGLVARNPALKAQFDQAGKEEMDHLAWTSQRLTELGTRPSLLNPLWYAGAFAIGLVAGRASDAISLGFVVETEKQVEKHLDEHLSKLPTGDARSRAIVAQMCTDEAHHAQQATQAGAAPLPQVVCQTMRLAAKLMTTSARKI